MNRLRIGAALVGAAFAMACGGGDAPQSEPLRPVVTTGVKLADVEERISATGTRDRYRRYADAACASGLGRFRQLLARSLAREAAAGGAACPDREGVRTRSAADAP